MTVDPSLIAGIRIKAKDRVIDNTIDTRLSSLKERINEK
ncbi:F0F1 ATP synthase subunit delta [Dubosiella newyorkensis]